jgi:PHD/YefM family antitoxin component YafN of YafNO toxin-antitoxin module
MVVLWETPSTEKTLMSSKEITVTEFRKHLPNFLYRILLKKESFTITNHGKPQGTIGPVTDPEDLKRLNRKLGR